MNIHRIDILRAIQLLVSVEIQMIEKINKSFLNEDVFANIINSYLCKFFDFAYIIFEEIEEEVWITVKFTGSKDIDGDDLEYVLFRFPKYDIKKWEINFI